MHTCTHTHTRTYIHTHTHKYKQDHQYDMTYENVTIKMGCVFRESAEMTLNLLESYLKKPFVEKTHSTVSEYCSPSGAFVTKYMRLY